MRRFTAILQTSTEPGDRNALWYQKGILRYYEAGEWRPFNVVYPEDINIKIDAIPNVKTLKEALDYLFEKSNNYKIVDSFEELDNLSKDEINYGTHCYVNDENKCYIYSKELNKWIEENNYNNVSPFYLLTDKTIITDFNATTGLINLKESDYADAVMYIAFGDGTSIKDLTLCRLERVEESWYLRDPSGVLPSIGQYVYIVATDRGAIYIPVIERDIDKEENYIIQTSIKYYRNSIESIFKEPIDIIEAITTNTDNINSLFTWKENIGQQQALQDAKILRNEKYAQELNAKIDAKVIEAGGVAFDLEPTKDSTNAVFSGGVYKYITEQVIYDVTANNDSATFPSLSALLSSENLSTLIPTLVRHGGMSIRFVQSSDNKYVQYFCKAQRFTTDIRVWEKVNLEEEVSQLGQYSNEETRYTDLYTDQIYNLNISAGNTPTLTPGAASGWSCVSFSVNAGDIVKIKAVGNVYSGRPYAILGEGNVVLKCAKDDDVSVADTEMIMPEGAKTFYANFKEYDADTQGVWKYVIVTIKQKIAEVNNQSLSNLDKIENIYGYFDVRNWISGYFYQADVRIGEGASANYECCKVPTRGLKEIHLSVSLPNSGVKCTLVDTEFNILEQWTGNVNEDIYLSEYPNAAFLYVSNYITNTNRYVKVVPSQSNPLLTQLERIKALGALPLSYSNPSSSGYLPANFINPLCFLHISDTHWHAGYVNTVKNAVELLNSIKLNQTSGVATGEILRFLIHTGDVAADVFTSDFNHYKNVVLESTKPCFLVIGNHDVGGTHKDIATSGTDAQVYEKMIEPFLQSWNLNNDGGGIAHPDGKCYYFNDFTTEKIRMIVLDAYETNFETVDGQLKYNRGDNGYTQDQITWFGNALVGTPSGYGVIIAKHAPCGTIGESESPFNSSADFGRSYEANNDFIPAIVQAFKNGDNLSLNPISATFNPTGTVQCVTDFSQKNLDTEFVCHLNGHTHKDHAYYVPNYPTQLNLGVGCDSTYSTIDADTAHVEGTISENLINAYAIDRNKGVIRIIRLGADISFEFQDRRFTQIPYRINP